MTRDRKNVKFVTFFPYFNRSHITKDVGMIPYILSRDFDYHSSILCYANDKFLPSEVPGLKILHMRRTWDCLLQKIKNLTKKYNYDFNGLQSLCIILDAIPAMVKYGKSIDILQLYHPGYASYIIGLIFKLVNRKGIIYLKLDWDPAIVDYYHQFPGELKRKRYILYSKLAPFDIVSAETKQLYEFAKYTYPLFRNCRNIFYVPNGVDVSILSGFTLDFGKKENIILHAGRIGTYQKATEVLLEAFARVANDFPDWKLVLIGSMENDFREYYADFLNNNKDVANRILYIGYLDDHDDIYEYFRKAKIFCLPSRFEGFAIALLEAGFFGDVIVGSDIPSTREFLNNGQYGYLCPVDDVNCFALTLRRVLGNDTDLAEKSKSISDFVKNNYDWNTIIRTLNDALLDNLH